MTNWRGNDEDLIIKKTDLELMKSLKRADEELTTSWWRTVEKLVKSWLRADERVTKCWWQNDKKLMKNWLNADEELIKCWWKDDEELIKDWQNNCYECSERKYLGFTFMNSLDRGRLLFRQWHRCPQKKLFSSKRDFIFLPRPRPTD